MCVLDFDDGPTVWQDSWRKARKEYECDCCDAPIRVGERYLYSFHAYDGNAYGQRLCAACEAERKVFAGAHGGQTPFPDSFLPYLEECIDEGDEESALKWKPMLERIEERRRTVRQRNVP